MIKNIPGWLDDYVWAVVFQAVRRSEKAKMGEILKNGAIRIISTDSSPTCWDS